MTSPVVHSVMAINGDLKHDEKADSQSSTESRPTDVDYDDDDGVTRSPNGKFDSESEEEDEYEVESDDESDDDDDEEPALKYERIGGSIPDLLKKDSASALFITNKLMVKCVFVIPIA